MLYFLVMFVYVLVLCFILTTLPVSWVNAQGLFLPHAPAMLHRSAGFIPAIMRGVKIVPNNPLEFDFIIDKGGVETHSNAFLQDEYTKLIKYFLASLTVPEDDLWVNLSPYEKNRIVPEIFGQTEMGRDLLAQDYLLKQLTATLMYPEGDLGKKFWKRVYERARQLYGNTNVAVNTFNKVWIMPDKATVYEHNGGAFVLEGHLKVMLEEDYLALSKVEGLAIDKTKDNRPETKDPKINALGSQIVRQIILPEIEKEVNEGKTFANLRQIYNSMILAAWYKNTLKESLLGKVYADKNKIKGIDVEDKNAKQKIYEQYLAAFKKGVYNYIKEDYDPHAQTMVPRKYFSGGVQLRLHFQTGRANSRGPDAAMTVLKDQSQIPQPLWAELFKHNVAVVTTRLAENATFRGAVPDRAMNAALAEAIENILSEKIRGFKKQQKIKIIEGIRKLVAQTEKPIFYLTSVDLEEKPTQGKVIPEVVLWRSHPTVSVGVMKKLVQTRLSGILSQLRPGLLEAVFEFGKNGRNVTGLGLIFKDRKAQFSPEERERLQQEILGVLDKVLELLPPDKAQLATAPNADRAMRTDEIDDVGGISLKPAHMNLQVKRDGKGVPLPVSMQPANMDIEGFLPVIIRVQDADMPQLLGLTDTRIKGTRT